MCTDFISVSAKHNSLLDNYILDMFGRICPVEILHIRRFSPKKYGDVLPTFGEYLGELLKHFSAAPFLVGVSLYILML